MTTEEAIRQAHREVVELCARYGTLMRDEIMFELPGDLAREIDAVADPLADLADRLKAEAKVFD